MKEPIIEEIEKKLSFMNATLANTVELLQAAKATVKYSCNTIYSLENEIEELYLALGEEITEADCDNTDKKSEYPRIDCE